MDAIGGTCVMLMISQAILKMSQDFGWQMDAIGGTFVMVMISQAIPHFFFSENMISCHKIHPASPRTMNSKGQSKRKVNDAAVFPRSGLNNFFLFWTVAPRCVKYVITNQEAYFSTPGSRKRLIKNLKSGARKSAVSPKLHGRKIKTEI